MKIKNELKNNINVVSLSGDVDLSNSPQVRKVFTEILSDKNAQILVNLTDVTYMDSSGLATLIEAMQKAYKNGGSFRLFGVQGAVKNMFEIARLDKVFTFCESFEA